jgi:hypothetical protein
LRESVPFGVRMAWRLPAASTLRAAFIAASVAWMLLLLAAPFAASRPHASPLGTLLIVGVYSIGSLVCHQLPERSYRLWTAQMPVCARCAGIYFGAALSAICAAALRNGARGFQPSEGLPSSARRSPERLGLRETIVAQGLSLARVALPSLVARGFSPARVALALAVVPTLLTLVYEWTTGDMPAHATRALAGVPFGAVAAWLAVTAAENQVN